MNKETMKIVQGVQKIKSSDRKKFSKYVSMLLNEFANQVSDSKQKDAIKESKNLIVRNL